VSGDQLLPVSESCAKNGIVLEDPDGIEAIAIRILNNLKVTQKTSVDAARSESVWRFWHGRIGYRHLGTIDIYPNSRQFLGQCFEPIVSVRQMDDCEAVEVIQNFHISSFSPCAFEGQNVCELSVAQCTKSANVSNWPAVLKNYYSVARALLPG
jgi:hypothetical protein